MSTNEPEQYVTKTGRVLTDADFEALADEAANDPDVRRGRLPDGSGQ